MQKAPELLNEIYISIKKCKYKFILTGSSAGKIRKKGQNLLAGRALTEKFYPLNAIESGKDFRLDHSLKYGQLPSVYMESDPDAYLESYVKIRGVRVK